MGDDLAWGDDLFRDTGHASDAYSIRLRQHRGIGSANVKRALDSSRIVRFRRGFWTPHHAGGPKCCRCNGNGTCVRCECSRNGRQCMSCIPSKKKRCRNFPNLSSQPTNKDFETDTLTVPASQPSQAPPCTSSSACTPAASTVARVTVASDTKSLHQIYTKCPKEE